MAARPPPPIPAIVRPKMITHACVARPQIRFPKPKRMFETTRPVRREYISVNLPLRGWHAAFDIRYVEASHESKVSELNEEEIEAERVAMTVVS